jgi:NADPH:quinone reductase-like Zn-dependent oxidoreductase
MAHDVMIPKAERVPVPQTMSGVVLAGHGDFDQLQWSDTIAVPRPARGEVLIRVRAAGVNNTDVNLRIGWYSKGDADAQDAAWAGTPVPFPLIQGIDACGHVAGVGAGVDPARIGERVLVEPCLREAGGMPLARPWFLGSDCDGAFAQYLVVASRHAYRVDSTLDDAALASFPCSYSTAENMLTRAGVTQDDRVLVTGASGGVGSAAVQLARARGAEVLAITSAEKRNSLRDLGASEALSRDQDLVAALGRDSIDVVVDLVGGAQWHALLEVLRPGGRLAVSGAIGAPTVPIDIRTVYLKDLSIFGCTVLEPQVFANLVARIEKGEIRPLVAKTYPLRQIRQAQQEFLAKRHVGKIVLTVSD